MRGFTSYKNRHIARIAVLFALLVVGWLAFDVVSAHAATGLRGRCGMHIGSLISRNKGGSLYHFRIGPKYPGTLRPGTCRGYVRVRRQSAGSIGALAWQHYRMLHYKAKTTLLIAGAVGTVGGCGAFASVMASSIGALVTGATDGVAFPGVVWAAGTLGCGAGAHWLYDQIPNGPNSINKVRMVK